MTRGNPALWTMKIQYSAITIHLAIRCLIYTQEEVKQPLDTGLGNSLMGSRGSVSKTEGRLLEWKAAASRPRAQCDPPTQKLLSSSTARKDSSAFHTQRQPCGHLTGVPRHDPEEAQLSEAIQGRARASWHLCDPEGRHILMPRKAFQSTVHGS